MLSPGGVRPASTISEESSSNEIFEGFAGMDGKKTVTRRRVGNAQRQVAAVRMVNATQRGELAGQKTAPDPCSILSGQQRHHSKAPTF